MITYLSTARYGYRSSSKNNCFSAISPNNVYSVLTVSAGASPRPTIRDSTHCLFCVHIVTKYAPAEL